MYRARWSSSVCEIAHDRAMMSSGMATRIAFSRVAKLGSFAARGRLGQRGLENDKRK